MSRGLGKIEINSAKLGSRPRVSEAHNVIYGYVWHCNILESLTKVQMHRKYLQELRKLKKTLTNFAMPHTTKSRSKPKKGESVV